MNIAVMAKDTSGDNLFTTLAIASVERYHHFGILLAISCTVSSNGLTKASLNLINFNYINEEELSEEQTKQVEYVKARIRSDKQIYFTCLLDEEFEALNNMPFITTLDNLTDVYADSFKATAWHKNADNTMLYTKKITFDQLEKYFS